MNPIELESQYLKSDKFARKMFNSELEVAYSVINVAQAFLRKNK